MNGLYLNKLVEVVQNLLAMDRSMSSSGLIKAADMITSHLQYKLCYWKRYLLVVVFADPGTKGTNIYSRHQDGNPTTQLKLIPNTPSRESEHLLFVKRLSTVIVKQSRGHNNLINYQQCNKKPIKYRYCKLFMNFLYTFMNTNSKILKIIFHYHLT